MFLENNKYDKEAYDHKWIFIGCVSSPVGIIFWFSYS